MTIDDPATLERLVERLRALRPDAARRWGTLDAGGMLCHLGDANDAVLRRRNPEDAADTDRRRPILKWLLLYAPIRWPKGARTRPGVDPAKGGTQPNDFADDRTRTIESLRALAAASAEDLLPSHHRLGPMSRRDWHRLAYRHTDHHLRQFGA